ncbi:hypothetical protein GCM10020001_091780 [Nonomuraea salmonea]
MAVSLPGRAWLDVDGRDVLGQRVHQRLFAPGQVVVDGHRLDLQRVAQPAHREAAQALAVGDVQRGLDDPLAGEGGTGGLLAGMLIILLCKGAGAGAISARVAGRRNLGG